jgi:hypothetical protein
LERLNKSGSSWPWNGKRAVDYRRQFKITPAMTQEMSGLYRQLVELRDKLEAHYREVQGFEFTIERGRRRFDDEAIHREKTKDSFPASATICRIAIRSRQQHLSSAALLCASR